MFSCSPLLEATIDGFVVGIALREELPLRPGVQNPLHGLQDGASGDRFAARTTVRDMFIGEMFPNPFPLVISQSEHDRTYREEYSDRQLF